MSSPVQAAIEKLQGEGLLSAALRDLVVVARRIGADSLTQTLRTELNGYPATGPLPPYRDWSILPVSVTFIGYAQHTVTRDVMQQELPSDLRNSEIGFRGPLAELEALIAAPGESDPRFELAGIWLNTYRRYAEKGEVAHMPTMVANRAFFRVPRTHMIGRLDQVRNAMLDFALDLEETAPAAGTQDGPRIQDNLELAAVAAGGTRVFAASGATVIIGDNNVSAGGDGAQAIVLQAGDVDGLLRAVEFRISQEVSTALGDAIDLDGGRPGDHTRGVLERIRSGSFALAAGLGVNGAYDGVVTLLRQVFPGLF